MDVKSVLLNILDINEQIEQTHKFSNDLLTQFGNMLREIFNFIKNTVFATFQYSETVLVIFIILLVGVLLFTKKRIANVLAVIYFFIVFIIIGLILAIVYLMIYLGELIYELIKQIIAFIKKPKEASFDSFFDNLESVFWIFVKCLVIFGVVVVLVCSLVVIYFASKINVGLFNAVNKMYALKQSGAAAASKYSGAAFDTGIGGIDDFGAVFQKVLQNC